MTNFVFHHYYREGAPKFSELGDTDSEADRSARRIKYLLGMPFSGDYNKEQLDRNRMGAKAGIASLACHTQRRSGALA